MNGRDLTLGIAAGLAVAGVVAQRRRGSRDAARPEGWDRLVALAPALYEAVEDAYYDDEDRDGATKLLASYLRANGFKVVGYGGSRVAVLLDPTHVAKVAAFDLGVRQNESEFGLWSSLKQDSPELIDLLIPVHDLDGEGIVLLTERAKPCVGATRKRCAPLLEAAQQRLATNTDTRFLLDPEYDFNWGFHAGRLKLLDYGQ